MAIRMNEKYYILSLDEIDKIRYRFSGYDCVVDNDYINYIEDCLS